jgi:hypothetical protein
VPHEGWLACNCPCLPLGWPSVEFLLLTGDWGCRSINSSRLGYRRASARGWAPPTQRQVKTAATNGGRAAIEPRSASPEGAIHVPHDLCLCCLPYHQWLQQGTSRSRLQAGCSPKMGHECSKYYRRWSMCTIPNAHYASGNSDLQRCRPGGRVHGGLHECCRIRPC